MTNRFDRQVRFFGKEGQAKLAACRVAVVGIGGLGTHVVQQLALLGLRWFALVDHEDLDTTNFNRYVGVRHDDKVPGTKKVDVGERLIRDILPDAEVFPISAKFPSEPAFTSLAAANYVFGCVDNEGARLILTEYCSAYEKPYIDVSSGIEVQHGTYGGTVCIAWDGQGCLICRDELDLQEAQRDLQNAGVRRNIEAIYGVPATTLAEVGPSVVSINGTIASVAVTEFMVGVTGIRRPVGLLRCRMDRVDARRVTYGQETTADCYYCRGIRGKGDGVDMMRYVRT